MQQLQQNEIDLVAGAMTASGFIGFGVAVGGGFVKYSPLSRPIFN
jgi:hypothetical protein